MWLENIPDKGVRIEGATFTGNALVGLDIGGGSRGIVIVNNHVADTATGDTQTEGWVSKEKVDAGQGSAGDGLIWGAGAEATIDGLTISGSGRNALLIDGPVSGSLSNVTFQGGDADKGIVQQYVESPAEAPSVSNAPALTQQEDAPSNTPKAPAAPAAI